MADKDNIRVAEEYVEALNAHDYARMSPYHGKNFRFQALGIAGPGDEATYQAYMERSWTAFPDLTFETAQLVAQGEYVLHNWIGTATHDGPWHALDGSTMPATGRKGNTSGSTTMKFKNGKIVLVDLYFNVSALLHSTAAVRGA